MTIKMEDAAKMAGLKPVYKDYGWLNGYQEIPEAVKDCEHPKQGKEIGNCAWEYHCPICHISYKIDSSG